MLLLLVPVVSLYHHAAALPGLLPIVGVFMVLCLQYGSHRVLRWPALALFGSRALLSLALLSVLQVAVRIYERVVMALRPTSKLTAQLAQLNSARSYEQWTEAARALDASLSSSREFLSTDDDPHYNAEEVADAGPRLLAT